jgi:heat-inducible transcriptional repressor
LLTERKQNILGLIIGEYILGASPVASETIAHKYGLGVSPATIRHEMAALEEDGYITRRHISGGGVPSDKGYRYYVESLIREEEVPLAERRMISHLFFLVERELEEWNRLAAALLARMLRSVAIVTFPKAPQTRFKHIELVALQEFLSLLILILRETRLKQQLIAFDQMTSQDELNLISNKLNALFNGLTRSQILGRSPHLSWREEQVTRAVVQMMEKEDAHSYGEMCIEGVRNILSQPEFSSGEKMLGLMDLLERGELASSILPEVVAEDGVQVIIGAENKEDAMRECSMVLARYGIPGEASGALGVVGPTRMPYDRAISRVRYMGFLLSDLIAQLYRGSKAG